MKILIVRHGDPDYEKDSLTEKGWREAELLAERLCKLTVTDFYVSPLGRARDTASLTLKKMGRTAVEYDWLQEFPPRILRPDVAPDRINAWDWLPEDWTAEPAFFDKDTWESVEIMKEGHVGEMYQTVAEGLDKILADHGYRREGLYYRTVKGNEDVLVFFCHFGVECVLLSHLMNISPMNLWHHMCAAPSSVTTIYTEERREGKVIFRVSSFGDISHLYAGGEEPSFSARFCEIFDSLDRHD